MTSEAPKDHNHRFSVYSSTGVHIGVWGDGLTAARVLEEHPGGYIEELVTTEHALAMVAAERGACARVAYITCIETRHGKLGNEVEKRILARTPDRAQAALEAMLKAEREKALREAKA